MWISTEKVKGISHVKILFVYLPRKLLRKLYLIVAEFINIYFLNYLINSMKFRTFQKLHKDKLDNHFYIIVMPNMLHYLIPCIDLIQEKIKIFLILNGSDKWEENYLKDIYPGFPIFKLINFPYSSLSHGRVINLLLKNNKYNFGIIDHDLYIFNEKIFNQIIFDKDEFVIGASKISNNKSNLTFPATHFLFFNVDLIQKIMAKYKIGAQCYRRIPSHLEKKLATLNLGYNNFLKQYLNYFDTFNLIMAMAFYEKMSAKILDIEYFDDIYHIGATSHGSDNVYHSYITFKLLELPLNLSLKKYYANCYKQYNNSKDLLKLVPKDISSYQFFRDIDRFMDKLENHLNKFPGK